jgi:hypothetical protein
VCIPTIQTLRSRGLPGEEYSVGGPPISVEVYYLQGARHALCPEGSYSLNRIRSREQQSRRTRAPVPKGVGLFTRRFLLHRRGFQPPIGKGSEARAALKVGQYLCMDIPLSAFLKIRCHLTASSCSPGSATATMPDPSFVH